MGLRVPLGFCVFVTYHTVLNPGPLTHKHRLMLFLVVGGRP